MMDTEKTAARVKAINEQKNYDIRKGETESVELIYKINEDANKELKSLFKEGAKSYEDAEKLKVQAVLDSQNEILELVEQERSILVQRQSELYVQGKISNLDALRSLSESSF